MSEYQYYDFQVVDRPVTEAEIVELRALYTRGSITTTRFQNVYHWGDFKGDPLRWMERYFDALFYVANWGTRRFMLRLPAYLLNAQSVRPYTVSETLTVHARVSAVILEFLAEDGEAASWMPTLLPLRSDLAIGDLRASIWAGSLTSRPTC